VKLKRNTGIAAPLIAYQLSATYRQLVVGQLKAIGYSF